MKKTLFAFLFCLSPLCFASQYYECQALAESDRIIFAQGVLSFKDNIIDGKRVLTDVFGEIRTDWKRLADEPTPYEFNGQFEIEEIAENTKYEKRIYKNHSQFKNFNAISSNIGMSGDLIVEKSAMAHSFISAHYVFHGGNHIAGVIDFECVRF